MMLLRMKTMSMLSWSSLFAQKYILIPIVGIIIDLIDVLWVLSRCFLLQDMDKLSSEGNVLASGGNKAF
ncbi:hypothetical protein NC653_025867 [Populus alba x Populus x berolinensis]|uniref:Uncharacterized protein n=1 Tax=Populus alba x Populus x berolinensis TaxID=444605 RepID=A0AAD6MCS4_9ROSI|nr:hypothetical protein NC653_025867 [Populus alba x Populus x berolinensis]